jgi:hypothetical protein
MDTISKRKKTENRSIMHKARDAQMKKKPKISPLSK